MIISTYRILLFFIFVVMFFLIIKEMSVLQNYKVTYLENLDKLATIEKKIKQNYIKILALQINKKFHIQVNYLINQGYDELSLNTQDVMSIYKTIYQEIKQQFYFIEEITINFENNAYLLKFRFYKPG